MKKLHQETCIPCTKDTPMLTSIELIELKDELDPHWEIVDNHHLYQKLRFKNFLDALNYSNKVAAIAEQENHHPNISFTWGEVELKIYTHARNGLSRSDFILASKIDQLK